jgi:hypothetical protein
VIGMSLTYCNEVRVTIDGVWIGNRICWTLKKLQITTTVSLSYTLQNHCNYTTYKIFSLFPSRCSVAASINVSSLYSGFPNSSRPQLQQCSTLNCPAYNILTRTAQKTPFLCCCFQLLPCKYACLRSRYLVTAAVYLLNSRSLPSLPAKIYFMESRQVINLSITTRYFNHLYLRFVMF